VFHEGGQRRAHLSGAQLGVRNEDGRVERVGRIEANGTRGAAAIVADDHKPAEQGGGDVVGVAVDFSRDAQHALVAELRPGHCLGRQQARDARRRGRAQTARERNLVVHLDTHNRRLQLELLQSMLEADQEPITCVDADLVGPLADDGQLLGAGRQRRDRDA
jgi:hypothetical protein